MNIGLFFNAVEAIGTVVSVGALFWSRRAAKLSEPTGNGWSTHVLTALDSITRRLDRIEERIDDRP
jgi:hypothetical protein